MGRLLFELIILSSQLSYIYMCFLIKYNVQRNIIPLQQDIKYETSQRKSKKKTLASFSHGNGVLNFR